MSQIELKIDLIGAANLAPQITVLRFTTPTQLEQIKQVRDRSLRITLSGTAAIRVVVEFVIPSTLLPAQKPMPSFFQDLIPAPPTATLPARMREIGSSAGGLPRNPRFIPVHVLGSAGGASIVNYRVDCTFLPMTEIARAIDPSRLAGFDGPLKPAATEFRLYECTLGPPRVWAVGFAPGAVPSPTGR